MIAHGKSTTKSDHIFFIRSTAHLENTDVLDHLVACNKLIVAPMLRTYARMRYGRKIVKDNSRWAKNVDESVSFFKAALSGGNVTGIMEKFLYGTNFVIRGPDDEFWEPLKNRYIMASDVMKAIVAEK